MLRPSWRNSVSKLGKPSRFQPCLEALETRWLPASFDFFPLPAGAAGLAGITAGPDGNVWFHAGSTGSNGLAIGRIASNGAISLFTIPQQVAKSVVVGPPSGGVGIAAGPDGNIWYTGFNGATSSGTSTNIDFITPNGTFPSNGFAIPGQKPMPAQITTGPDGNLWFVDSGQNAIGKITTAGAVTEFSITTTNSQPEGITAGPDGNIWFVEAAGRNVGRISPDGAIVEFPTTSLPSSITTGPDGNLWFTDGLRIGRMTPAGALTEFPIPSGSSSNICAGSDGNLYFTEMSTNKIGRITRSGSITEFPIPQDRGVFIQPSAVTAGPDGNIWFLLGSNAIGRLLIGPPPTALHLVVTNQPPVQALPGTNFDVRIGITDVNGNLLPNFMGTVGISPQSNPGKSTLGGTLSKVVAGGVADFPDLTLDNPGTAYVLLASGSGVGSTVTIPFNVIVPTAGPHLVITMQPPATVGLGKQFGISVTEEDGFGKAVTSFNAPLVVALVPTLTNDTVSGTLTAVASQGVATFSNLSVTTGGNDFVLQVSTADGKSSVLSTPFSVAVSNATLNAQLINQFYKDLLQRPADTAGLNNWVGLLNTGSLTRQQVATTFVASPEFLSDEVQNAYLTILNRAADSAGLSQWQAFLKGGGTLLGMESLFYGSPEFFQNKNGGGGTNDGFVTAMYQRVLGRPVDSLSLQIWEQQLTSGTTRSQVAAKILGSSEAESKLVQSLYEQYLHRAADTGGLAAFTKGLQAGIPVETIIALMVGSSEYARNAQSNTNAIYVAELSRDLLDRAPDAATLSSLTNELDLGQVTRNGVAQGILRSVEYQTDLIQSLFQRYLNRAADPAGLASALMLLTHGGTDEAVAATLVTSDEFFQDSGGTNAGFLNTLYLDALGRPVDGGGLQFWEASLQAGVTRAQIVSAVFGTTEYRAAVINGFYVRFLGRTADNSGLTTFGKLFRGGATDETVLADILGSGEYFARV